METMEPIEFRALTQKKKLALIAQMRREAESAITQVWELEEFRKKELAAYASLHRNIRSLILSGSDDENRVLSNAWMYLAHAYRVALVMLQKEQQRNQQGVSADEYDAMLDQSRADLQEQSADQQRIDDAVERKVQEQKNKGGRPRVGEKKGVTVRMPDDEWVPVRAVINYYGYTDAEFFAEAAKFLASKRTESMEPEDIEHFGDKYFSR